MMVKVTGRNLASQYDDEFRDTNMTTSNFPNPTDISHEAEVHALKVQLASTIFLVFALFVLFLHVNPISFRSLAVSTTSSKYLFPRRRPAKQPS